MPRRSPAPPADARAGFTLMEVVVALALGALLLLGARTMYGELADHTERISAAAADADREANTDAWLRGLLGRVEINPDQERAFAGDAAGARFATWCEVPAGWLERCTASLGLIRVAEVPTLAVSAAGQVTAVRRGFARGELIYLRDAAGGGQWSHNWTSQLTAPLAVGIVIDADTLLLRIGERG